jgi:RND family efflux transporter MFP subunit
MSEQFETRGRSRMVVIGIVVVGLALLLWFYLRPHEKEAPVAAKAGAVPAAAKPETPETIDVTSAAAVTRNLERGLEVVGSMMADEEVLIGAQAAGELAQLNVDFGSFVTAGQVIAQIDQRDAKLRIEQSEAALRQTMARLGMKDGEKFEARQNAEVRIAQGALDLATVELDRAARLIEKGDIARSVYDQARINHSLAQARHQAAIDAVNQQLAVVEQQRAALALARKSLTDTVVRAPITGAVKEKFAARGAYLAMGGRIMSLVKINPLRLRADVPEYAAAAVKVGQSMTLRVEAFPDQTFSGRIVRIGASLSEQTRALTVEAEVANGRNQLRPGMFAKSNLILSKASPVVLVPQRSIVTSAGLSKIFVIESGKAVERIVQTGVIDGDLIEIREGIREGEIVATSNTEKLQQGSAVRSAAR